MDAGGLRRYMKSRVRFLTKHQRRAHPPPPHTHAEPDGDHDAIDCGLGLGGGVEDQE